MTEFVIVVGDLGVGVQNVFGPFPDELAAREWAQSSDGEDRFDYWFSIPLDAPTI
jgi:hypothetical protein